MTVATINHCKNAIIRQRDGVGSLPIQLLVFTLLSPRVDCLTHFLPHSHSL
jgi:hypothetical protein